MKNNTNKTINITYLILLIVGIIIALTGIGLKMINYENKIADKIIFFGIAQTGVCAVFLIRRKTNAEYAKKENLEAKGSDERDIQIKGKAHTISWQVTEVILIIGSIVFWIMENRLYASASLLLFLIHDVSYYIAKAYYNKKM